MGNLVFDEKSLVDGNIFKYEERLHSHMNKYIDGGMILTTYYSQDQLATTVDRGTMGVDELFGTHSPLRFQKILDFPLYSMKANTPEDAEDVPNARDIQVEGDVHVLPGTIVPQQHDYFIINHMKMTSVFEVTSVSYDSMKVDGFYKIHYRLFSTNQLRIDQLEEKVVSVKFTDLNAVGGTMDPVISEDDMIRRRRCQSLIKELITSYRSMYYNDRHNCFLFFNTDTRLHIYDPCAGMFIQRHNLMNDDSISTIMLTDKLGTNDMMEWYNKSIYKWIEVGAPVDLLQKFPYVVHDGYDFRQSSFYRYDDIEVRVMEPLKIGPYVDDRNVSYLVNGQLFDLLFTPQIPPIHNEFVLLLWKYIHGRDQISMKDVDSSLLLPMMNYSQYQWDVFFFVPIIIHIINEIFQFN